MRRIISLPAFFALVVSFTSLGSESKGLIDNSIKIHQTQDNSKKELFNLSVTCFEPSQPPGGSFSYSIRLSNLLGPVANAEIKIKDPFDRVITSVKTDYNGSVFWFKQIPINAKQQLYVIEFYYENAKQYSKIAVSTNSSTIQLPGYSIELKITNTLDEQTLLLANRGGFKTTSQDIKTTLIGAAKFGLAVAKDFAKSPKNLFNVVMAVSTCSSSPSGVTAPLCILYVNKVVGGIMLSTIKERLLIFIDKTVEDEAKKKILEAIVGLASTGISVSSLSLAGGFIDNMEAIFNAADYIDYSVELITTISDEIIGASFSAQKKSKNEVDVYCFYDTRSKSQSNVQTSKDPNCNENSNGDYCFQNNTQLDLQVRFNSSPNKIAGSYTSPYSCTLQPGQKQCFFDVPAGAASYEIKTQETYRAYKYGDTVVPYKEYYGQGSLYVDKCQENTFFINLETPSYSSNITSQTNESQTSKESNCKEKYTGDYCFRNTTGMDLQVRLNSSPNKNVGSYTSPYSCTLQPGQTQCFFNVPAGAARYEIRNMAGINISGYRSTGTPSTPKTYFAEGSLYVELCQGKTFIIK